MAFNFNPGDVLLRGRPEPVTPIFGGTQTVGPKTGRTNSPYMNTGPTQSPQVTLGAQAVRASGSGPFDPAYRQDLATYAGGNFARPGGSLSFNPTGALFGSPTGGGNAPLPGMPTDLLSSALGAGGFQAQTSTPTQSRPNRIQGGDWRDWLNDYRGQGRLLRTY